MNIKINITELATKLAHKELSGWYNSKWDFTHEEDGVEKYTEKGQGEFNELYDKYWDIIINTIVYPFKEGDDYYTIEQKFVEENRGHMGTARIFKTVIVWSCWDNISEEFYREDPNRSLFKTKEQAQKYINKSNK